MVTPGDLETNIISGHPEHCVNQIAMRCLKNGDLLAVFNEERYPYHHDSGQTLISRSKDGGRSWSEPKVVVPWTETEGNWDCGICELHDGTLIVNFTVAGFFRRGVRPEGVSWASHPSGREWGDWTWSRHTRGCLGTYVVRSGDGGETWSRPIPVNIRPLKHGGCRLGCWQLPGGELLLGLYGRIRGYEESGEYESTRSALMRSDDGGFNWEYFSTLAFDPASIIDYEEPALLRLHDGRLVCFLRTHNRPSEDARNMVVVVSDDNGYTWSPPKWTNIWGYPADAVALHDGRYLCVYGYRRPPYGTFGCLSEDGITWDKKDEFIIRKGGVPDRPGTIDWNNPGEYQHIGYPTVAQLPDGTVVAAYHEWNDAPEPLQHCLATRFTL